MKRQILLILIAGTYCSLGQNQTFCGVDRLIDHWLMENSIHEKPEFKNDENSTLKGTYLEDKTFTLTTAPIYTIPVVFHILHTYGIENIRDAQVIDQLNILNRDYRKLNADTSQIYSPFKAADARFEFRLATRDTNGNCTSGIIHHYDVNTNWNFPPNISQYKYTWNPTRYLNIYVVKQITGFGSGGYTSLPGLYSPEMDVVVIMNNSIGSIGTSNLFRSRLLTHEIGHWFNLLHPWVVGGNYLTTCGDDYVSDTPVTQGFAGCPSQGMTAICNPTIQENAQNYMDYSTCSRMFTTGQVARMTTAITNTVGGRNNVWTNANLISTGVINPMSPCAPIADFIPNTYTLCSGSSATFSDISWNASPTTWSWTATGSGTITNPSSSITSIYFNTVGTQTITMVAANGTGSSVVSKTVSVFSSTADIEINYPESFENPGLPAGFAILNPDFDVTWSQTSIAAATGSNCYFINGSEDAPASNPDILETPSYDFSLDPNASFTFKYAYAKSNNSNTDVFKVLASSDCGNTWINIYQPTNTSMASASGGVSNISFTPTPNQFVTYTLSNHPNFIPFLGLPWVKIRFSFKEDTVNGYGNNIFLDDINFNSYRTAGFQSFSKAFECILFPNPTQGRTVLEFQLSDPSLVEFSVFNTVGELLLSQYRMLESGKHSVPFNEDGKLKAGVYIINVNINGQRLIKKLVIY